MTAMKFIIERAAKESGLPKEKIEDITACMVEYLNTGYKYGKTVEGFYYYYTKDLGNTLHSKQNIHN